MLRLSLILFYVVSLFANINALAETLCPINRPISLQTANWDSIQIQHAIHETLWQVGFKCETISTQIVNTRDLTPLTTGKVDYYIEVWGVLIKDLWRQVLNNHTVVVLGPNFNASKGLYVPNYMITKQPDLVNYSQLNSFLPHFVENGDAISFFIGGSDWSNVHHDLNAIALLKLKNILRPVYAASESEQAQQVMHAMLFHRPFIVSSWEPSALTSVLSLTRLKVDSNSLISSLYTKTFPVYLATSVGFYDNHPDVVNIVSKLTIPEDIIKDLVAKKFEYGWTPTQTAHYFFTDHAPYWRSNWGLFPQVVARLNKYFSI